jgi:hypothetical protein
MRLAKVIECPALALREPTLSVNGTKALQRYTS